MNRCDSHKGMSFSVRHRLFGLIDEFVESATEVQFHFSTYLAERRLFILVAFLGVIGFIQVTNDTNCSTFSFYFVIVCAILCFVCALLCLLLPYLPLSVLHLTQVYENLVVFGCAVSSTFIYVSQDIDSTCLQKKNEFSIGERIDQSTIRNSFGLVVTMFAGACTCDEV